MEEVEEVLLLQPLADHGEELADAGVDDDVERAVRDRLLLHERGRAADGHARLVALVGDERRGRLRDFQLLRLRVRRLEGVGDVVRDVVAPDAEDARREDQALRVGGVAR